MVMLKIIIDVNADAQTDDPKTEASRGLLLPAKAKE